LNLEKKNKMQKHYFELDKVTSVTLNGERESFSYYWKDAVPARPKKFLGIIIGTLPEVPAGWSEYKEEYEYEYSRRKQSSYFEDYKFYRVDEVAKKIYNKAHGEVRFGYKQSIGQSFNSTEEAQAWVDEIIASSDKKFHIIINK
jgi:hypothetical protein